MDRLIIIFIISGAIVIATVIAVIVRKKDENKIHNYMDIYIGMPENDLLDMMSNHYSRSLLKDGRKKYEWIIDGSTIGTGTRVGNNFIYGSSHSNEQRVTVYVKQGKVEEVEAYNI